MEAKPELAWLIRITSLLHGSRFPKQLFDMSYIMLSKMSVAKVSYMTRIRAETLYGALLN